MPSVTRHQQRVHDSATGLRPIRPRKAGGQTSCESTGGIGITGRSTLRHNGQLSSLQWYDSSASDTSFGLDSSQSSSQGRVSSSTGSTSLRSGSPSQGLGPLTDLTWFGTGPMVPDVAFNNQLIPSTEFDGFGLSQMMLSAGLPPVIDPMLLGDDEQQIDSVAPLGQWQRDPLVGSHSLPQPFEPTQPLAQGPDTVTASRGEVRQAVMALPLPKLVQHRAGKERYPCELPGCDVTFSRPTNRPRHYETMHAPQEYSCPIAGCIYKNKRIDKVLGESKHARSHLESTVG